ncbi:MAG: FliG C-terminal domain-containing protein [Bdellovibrionales bacterium]
MGKYSFGFQSALEALRGLSAEEQERLLSEIAQKDPETAKLLRDSIFTFEDLSRVNSKGIQNLLQNTDDRIWPLALRFASDDVIKNLKSNMSQRRFSELESNILSLGPQPKSKVLEAQKTIMDIAKELKERGLLVVVENDEDPLV